jgi:hypothetical protein
MTAASPSARAPRRPSAGVVADLTRASLEHQLSELSSIDSKAATLVGLIGVLLGLLFTSDYVTKHWSTALSVGAGVLAAAALSLVVALWPSRTHLMPNPVLAVRITHISEEEMNQSIAEATAQSILKNQTILRRKRWSLAIATFGVVAAVVLIAGDLICALR